MKKVSAFSVFSAKKKEKEVVIESRPPLGNEAKKKASLSRAASSQSMEKTGKSNPGSASRGKKILSGIRESIRMSGKKSRPASQTIADSPFSSISLDSLKIGSTEKKLKKSQSNGRLESATADLTPVTSRKSPRQRDAAMKKKASSTSLRSLKVLKQKQPSPKSGNSSEENRSPSTNGNVTDSQKLKKRKSLDAATPGSASKKRKVNGEKKKKPWRPRNGSGSGAPADSALEATRLFECMIHPVKPDRFFTELWEKKPLLVKRHAPDYNKGWFSTADFDKILRQENIQWGVNLDATSFVNDKRETHNQAGRALAPVVWDMYQAGCSLRLLNPQTYSRSVWRVLSTLQEFFGCCIGANIYLTPPGTQGFAPHYDDIEAFIIQLEGKKHWRLYSPRNDDEILPQFSSGNFSGSEVGEPILDVVLEAGDLLYFPRGTIHQGNATDEHSLHITVSCYQMNTWGDYLKKLLCAAVDQSISENVEFRAGLPLNYLNYMGLVHSERDLPERQDFHSHVQGLLQVIAANLPLDSAADQMGKQLMHDAMPPLLSEGEKSCSVHGAGERWCAERCAVVGVSELTPATKVKLVRRACLRLLTEEDAVRVYYNVDNARIYHGAPPSYIEISPEQAQAVEQLVLAYPAFTPIEQLCLENLGDQVNIASILYEKGLLVTSEPIEPTYDEGESTDDET